MEYSERPRVEVVGSMRVPREATKTPPRPIPRGPAQLRNLSLGAQAATVLKPPMMPGIQIHAYIKVPINKLRN